MRPVVRSSLTVLAAGAVAAVAMLPSAGGHSASGTSPATELVSRRLRVTSSTTSSSTSTSTSSTSTSTPSTSTSTPSTSTSTSSTSTSTTSTSTTVPAGGSLLW